MTTKIKPSNSNNNKETRTPLGTYIKDGVRPVANSAPSTPPLGGSGVPSSNSSTKKAS